MKKTLITIGLALAIIVAFGSSPIGASACGCQPKTGVKVASGKSEGGIQWAISVSRYPKDRYGITFDASQDSVSSSDNWGYQALLPGRKVRNMTFFAVTGSDLGSDRESDLSGVAGRAVKTLLVKMKSGNRLRFSPRFAPQAKRERIGRARTLRYFDVFFPKNENPVRMTALDKDKTVIDRIKSSHGSFN
ncbi:MAG: hypothetical protein WBW62_12535 [Solirubrobacterales bacterium]